MTSRNIAIFRTDLLPLSETFIRDQAESLVHFRPIYVGRRRVEGLELPEDRTLVVNEGGIAGKVREVAFKTFRRDRRLLTSLTQQNPVLVHAHFEVGGIEALPLARALRIPLLVTCWGYDVTAKDEFIAPNPAKRILLRLRRRQLQQRANNFLACSGFLKERMVERGYPAERTIVHYNCVDTNRFTADPLVPREPIVLFVGRLVEKKGGEYLIHAMARVQKIRPEIELVIIGDGPLRAVLEKQAVESLRKFRFLGSQSGDVVLSWLNRVMVFCLPSVTAASGDSEGLPTVLAEAGAMGVPCASTWHSGIPEVVAHGETGLLAEERNSEQLGRNILQLLNDRSAWNDFSRAARQRVLSIFSLTEQTRKLEKIYAEAIDRP